MVEIHAFFNNKNRVKNIKDAYNEIIKLLESNEEKGIESTINIEQNLFLIIPYQPNFNDYIKFELKKEGLNAKDKLDIFLKIIKDLKSQINKYKNGKKYKGKKI